MSKKIILTTVIAFCCLGNFQSQAQKYRNLVREEAGKAANIYYPYHRLDSVYTPSPSGYKPFYISHYGRHGSRYHTSEKKINGALNGLRKMEEARLLTADGQEMLHQLEILLGAHKGMSGHLSPRGGREHRGIARRMYEHYPEVFRNKKRPEVRCVSSHVPRCIMSMTNFTNQLKGDRPQLQFSFVAGERYYDAYICRHTSYENWFADARAVEDSLRPLTCSYDRLYRRIFTDPEKAVSLMEDPQDLIRDIYTAGTICGDLDFLHLDLLRFFDPEELAQQGLLNNIRTYGMMGNSEELGRYSSEAGSALVRDFVHKADTALMADSPVAANLRFGHDTGILPFLNCLGIEGMDRREKMEEGGDRWMAFDMTPMGTNFQMVFYRNRKGHVLVKMLQNEKETTIPAVSPYEGPYYEWDVLRTYLTSLYE